MAEKNLKPRWRRVKFGDGARLSKARSQAYCSALPVRYNRDSDPDL